MSDSRAFNSEQCCRKEKGWAGVCVCVCVSFSWEKGEVPVVSKGGMMFNPAIWAHKIVSVTAKKQDGFHHVKAGYWQTENNNQHLSASNFTPHQPTCILLCQTPLQVSCNSTFTWALSLGVKSLQPPPKSLRELQTSSKTTQHSFQWLSTSQETCRHV